MKNALHSDIIRTIKKDRKRLLALMIITALGVMMMCGLKASCDDLRASADSFFDRQKLHDLSIQSTLGLTEEDLTALKKLDLIEDARGNYREEVTISFGSSSQTITANTFLKDGIDCPYVLEGRLPKTKDEIAVTGTFLQENDLSIGDHLTLEDKNDPAVFTVSDLTITACVTDIRNVTNPDSAMSFRSSEEEKKVLFLHPEAVDSEMYTSIELTVKGASDLSAYSQEYKELVQKASRQIEKEVKSDRENARYESVYSEAQQQIDEAKQLLNSQFSSMQGMTEAPAMEGTLPNPVSTAELIEKRTALEQEISDAEADLDAIPRAVWYVQDREDLTSFANTVSDSDCIEAVGSVFPVMFLIIAVLISLTTITRMVEEDRGLIGTYQALGFYDREIRRKYLVYTMAACLLGGILGNIGGFIVLPEILFVIFDTMYVVPQYEMLYSFSYGIGGIILFAGSIAAATVFSCEKTLKEMPASLMRPKPPGSGSRIILERISFLWRRMNFLNKVTARNLFRYKKRFLMTVIGIAGCTGLLVCGFSIKDTVSDLMVKQYDEIVHYDLMVVNSGDEDNVHMTELLEEYPVKQKIPLEITSVTILNEQKESISAQLYVTEDIDELRQYLSICDTKGDPVKIRDDRVYVTVNASRVLAFETGDQVSLQDPKLNRAEVKVGGIVQNYLGNSVFMTRDTYESLFEAYEENASLVKLEKKADELAIAEEIDNKDFIVSVTSTQDLKNTFSQSFKLMNTLVYIVIALAAGLAFVVLFTLSATNISERERELATIKVLGFYDREVHHYVNRETLILTGIGILCGCPLGVLFSYALMFVLKLPAVEFAISIHATSFLFSAVLAFLFALAADLITNRTLDRIDPVEALKSVE